MARKVFVEVTVRFDKEGNMRPEAFVWEDGERYEIDRIIDIRPAPSLKVGGAGIRYTCRVMGNQHYLFYDYGKWFVEAMK